MTDNIAIHPLRQLVKGTFSKKIALSALLSISVLAQPANAAEQEWWFDVEVILFERNLDATSISEKFKQSRLEQPTSDMLDILTPYIKPDLSYLRAGLPYCRASNQLAVKTQYEQDFAFPEAVTEINETALSATNNPIDQSEVTNSDVLPDENFEYEVATTDVFSQTNEKTPTTLSSDTIETNAANLELNNSDTLEQQENQDLTTKVNFPSLPIQVNFIEWQIPSIFPCAYSEQIDASFAAITPIQNSDPSKATADLVKHVPEVINGTEWAQKRSAFLLPAADMRMDDLYNKIKKQRDITPILHLNWRQQVYFGRDNGKTIRLFAGQNFADQFDAKGLPLNKDTDSLFNALGQKSDDLYVPEQELALMSIEQQRALFADTGSEVAVTDDFFARIDAALIDNTPINIDQTNSKNDQKTVDTALDVLKEIWRIDGGITVYLRNVGRIPYLHIDSDLDFRQPIFDPKKTLHLQELSDSLPEQGAIVANQLRQPNSLQPNFLQSVNFNQLRRVISKQVHYFDHPLFGMLVSINRYRWPQESSESTESDTPDN